MGIVCIYYTHLEDGYAYQHLMQEALKATGLKTKKEVVELGLKTLVTLRKQAAIKDQKASSIGTVAWTGLEPINDIGR